jgi:hypothetical protein
VGRLKLEEQRLGSIPAVDLLSGESTRFADTLDADLGFISQCFALAALIIRFPGSLCMLPTATHPPSSSSDCDAATSF